MLRRVRKDSVFLMLEKPANPQMSQIDADGEKGAAKVPRLAPDKGAAAEFWEPAPRLGA